MAAGHSNNMFSRVASGVILHSAKNRTFISPAPSKFLALFSGTPNRQDCESKPADESDNPLSPEVIDELRNIFLQVSREDYKGYYLDELIRNNTSEDPGDDHVFGANCCLSPLFFRLMRDVAFEVATFHQNRVIHGNINPHNIFIFKGRRLFAKLLDDDTSKWKAPEQLLNGSQTTKASDMFNLGCVLFTCITKGGQPFGDTLDQHHENVKQNKKCLSRVKSYPEAFNLLSRLLNHEPELRPIAMEVLSHPIFWHSEKRLAFLQCCSKQIEYEIKQSNSEILEDLDSIAPIVMDEKWDEEIRSVRLSCSFEEVQSLLQFIRETFSHYDLMPVRLAGYIEELQPFGDSLKPHYRLLDEYLARRYPWLLIYLHNLMLKHFGNSSWFSVYCLREFNQRPHTEREYHDLGEGDGLGYGDGNFQP